MNASFGFGPRLGETSSFRRPTSRVIVDLVGLPIGATLFLGAAWLMLTGAFVEDGTDPITTIAIRFVAPLFFGSFGLLMASSIPSMLRRGLRRTVLKVGPEGMWTPEMGPLAWNEIADVRLEAISGFSGEHGDEGPASTTYRRLSIYPLDARRGTEVRNGLSRRLLRWMQQVTRLVQPSARVRDLADLAPYGVFDYELERPIEQAVTAVERYRPVAVERAPAA